MTFARSRLALQFALDRAAATDACNLYDRLDGGLRRPRLHIEQPDEAHDPRARA